MKIGSLTRATGVSARSLRYYEQQGLLTADRTAGGQREYSADAADRVHLITSLLAAGLSTSSIYDVLPCITEASIRTPALAARLGAELNRVDARITALTATRQILAALVARYTETHHGDRTRHWQSRPAEWCSPRSRWPGSAGGDLPS